jgi:uncharacterized membrane protein required for colicin V production
MTFGTMDIFLLVIIVSTLIVGFFWGAARSLLLLAAWLVAFLAGAYLKLDLGSYLAQQWDNFPPAFSEMAAFGVIFVFLLLLAPVIIVVVTRSNQHVTNSQVLDDFVGAGFAIFVAVLGIATVLIILGSFYGTGDAVIDSQGGPTWTATLYQSLLDSTIGSGVNDVVVPIIGVLLGTVLPPEVREVFG